MPSIRFKKDYPTISVEPGANLMEELLFASMPVASSCHGDGICGKCRVIVISGAEHLTPPNAAELIVRDRLKIPREQRLSCQTQVNGDIVIDTNYW